MLILVPGGPWRPRGGPGGPGGVLEAPGGPSVVCLIDLFLIHLCLSEVM